MSEENRDLIELRHLCIEDYVHLRSSMDKAYEQAGLGSWKEKDIRRLLDIFPDGQLCITVDGKVVASALALIINYKDFGDNHTYNQIHGNNTFNTHDPEGDVLYGIDVFVHPDYRGMRLGRRLYEGRKELCENLNLKAIMAGGRIPRYKEHAADMSPRVYIEKVQGKEIYDPTLTFQLSNGFHVRKVLKNYLEGDVESHEFATLLEWNNIYYQPNPQVLNVERSEVRVGLVQWQMRQFVDMDSLMEQAEYFVDAVSDYKADFMLFPEFFNAPLMSPYNHLPEPKAIRELAAFAEPLRERFSSLAVAYNVNIITGSMPVVEDDQLLNVSYLCRRDGSYESFYKIHPTPSEVEAWGMMGGDKIQAFDTDCGKIGIQICYDVEFPESCRILADQGMKILFVPFLTDTQNGYMRVRHCAQARAIENECYVVIAGAVGNLPNVNNMDIQYAQSAILTPSDFSFPTNTIKAEATPNTEMVLIADVNLDLLKELHSRGSVRNLKDRRKDLYTIQHKQS
ncbi:bifunctional GNAT family N-acetyltransferase/carbon-nitrogen hydrolase family protein [Pontiellaceae bacterium B12219]|nr:bifunctional GNAT family N-acetyltransferase/carbon-nitrogen hydrolase family protein [Pontiellaceae bacterium B12219]